MGAVAARTLPRVIVALSIVLLLIHFRMSFGVAYREGGQQLPHLSETILKTFTSQPQSQTDAGDTSEEDISDEDENAQDDLCDGFPDMRDVMVVFKTGANEAFNRVPTHLMTTLRCVPNLLMFSDLEQDIGPYHVYDALDNVTESIKESNHDFDYYRMLQDYQNTGRDVLSLAAQYGMAAWVLDKWKFPHMVEKTYTMRPGFKWYFFIEDDTYVFWSNLMQWLGKKDPSTPLYLGSAAMLGKTPFGHGGSGYVISHAAMDKLIGQNSGFARGLDAKQDGVCCGDYTLATGLLDVGIPVTNRWPLINGENPKTIPFKHEFWCRPLLTMHHMNTQDISNMWRYEQQRENSTDPILQDEIFRYGTEPQLQAERDDWYNLSNDKKFENAEYPTFEACGDACKADSNCFQWSHHNTTCGFSYSIRLGEKKLPENAMKHRSGWDMDQIAQFRRDNGPCTLTGWDDSVLGFG